MKKPKSDDKDNIYREINKLRKQMKEYETMLKRLNLESSELNDRLRILEGDVEDE